MDGFLENLFLTNGWNLINEFCLPVGVLGRRDAGENLHHINPSLSSLKIGYFLRRVCWSLHPATGGGGGTKTRPIPAQRNAGHPDPLPASVILHLASGCPLTGMSGSRVQDDGGVGGGSGGRGVDSSARATTLGCSSKSRPHPNRTPFLARLWLPSALTSEGGGHSLVGRG